MFIYYAVTFYGMVTMQYIQNRKNKQTQKGLNRKRDKYIYVVPFIPMFLVSALRYGIGTDYFYTYYPTFRYISNGMKTSYALEQGFFYLNKIVAAFSDDVTWVMAICALLFFVFIGLAIVQQSENPAMSIALLLGTGLYSYSMNGVRQSIVIAVWFYSMKYIKEKRFVPFFICMLVSSLFHTSALVLIPFYFIFQKKIKPIEAVGVICGAFVFNTIFKKVILFISSFTKYYSKFIGSSLMEGDFAYSTFFVSLGVLIYLLFLYRQLNKYCEYNFLLMSTTIATVCSILTKDIYLIARILSFFQYVPLLYLPLTLKAFKGKTNKIIASLFFVLLYFLYIWFMVGYLGKGDTVPYQSIFSR